MKKIFIVFMVILLLGLSIIPSFAAYNVGSVSVVDNDSDSSDVYIDYNYLFNSYTSVSTSSSTTSGLISVVVPFVISFYVEAFPSDYDAWFISLRNSSASGFSNIYGSEIYNYLGSYYSVTITSTECFYINFHTNQDGISITDLKVTPAEDSSVLLDDGLTYNRLSFLSFSSTDIDNRGLYVQAFSDSDLTSDITSDVATSSGLTVDSDGLIYLEFEDGETDQLYYDGTVYYQVTLDPSPPYIFVNLYRHIFENFAGTYTFLTEDNWIFITCVSSIAICFVIFVGVFFFKRFSH